MVTKKKQKTFDTKTAQIIYLDIPPDLKLIQTIIGAYQNVTVVGAYFSLFPRCPCDLEEH